MDNDNGNPHFADFEGDTAQKRKDKIEREQALALFSQQQRVIDLISEIPKTRDSLHPIMPGIRVSKEGDQYTFQSLHERIGASPVGNALDSLIEFYHSPIAQPADSQDFRQALGIDAPAWLVVSGVYSDEETMQAVSEALKRDPRGSSDIAVEYVVNGEGEFKKACKFNRNWFIESPRPEIPHGPLNPSDLWFPSPIIAPDFEIAQAGFTSIEKRLLQYKDNRYKTIL